MTEPVFPYGITRETDDGLITSPWLTADEAGVYCGWETGEPIRKAVRQRELIPDRGTIGRGEKMRFRIETLDAWMQGQSGEVGDESQHPQVDSQTDERSRRGRLTEEEIEERFH